MQYRTSWQPTNLYGSGGLGDLNAGDALDPKYPQGTLTEEYSYTAAGQMAKKRLRVRRGPAVKDLEATLTYAGDVVKTIAYPNGGPTYTYEYDAYKRPVGLLEGTVQLENGVTYGAAGEVLQRVEPLSGTSTRTTSYTYNSLLQLTRIRKNTNGYTSDVEYRYTATINNGQVMQEYSQATGETVNYQYDELNRLISARNVNTSKWGMEWEYDGFGNRTVQRVVQGSAVPITLTYDAATNRITSPGYVYNARGELTAMPKGAGSQTLAWDWGSRLKQAGSDTAGERYDYSAGNRLVYTKEMTTGAEAFTFRLGAQVLGTYRPTVNTYGTITGFSTTSTRRAPFLDGLKQHPGSTDSYFPYGEKKEPPMGSEGGFGTYSRREATGLDYADQRWYSSTTGRFLTPDPYIASGGPARPGSWNRYGYVEGDPVNRVDPTGLDFINVTLMTNAINSMAGIPTFSVTTYSLAPVSSLSTSTNIVLTPALAQAWGIGNSSINAYGGFSFAMSGAAGGSSEPSPADQARAYLNHAINDVLAAFARYKDCAALFYGTGLKAPDVLNGLNDGGLGNIKFVLDGAIGRGDAMVHPRQDSWDGTGYLKVDILINASRSGTGYWSMTTARNRARMLTHELGHVTNLLKGGGGSAFRDNDSDMTDPVQRENQAFNQGLLDKCFPN